MKRRGFLGFLGGATIAGPGLAASAVKQLPQGIAVSPVTPFYSGSSAVGVVSTAGDTGWKLKQITDIRRFLSGEMTDEEKEDRKRQRLYRREQVINQNVACLLSVSGAQKMAIYSARIEQHHEEIARSEQQSRLHWLLRQDD